MHRTDANGNVSNLFDDGDPLVPRLPTQIDKAWLNAVQEEIANCITAAGIALVKGTNNQLSSAVVHKALSEIITGLKTFQAGIEVTDSTAVFENTTPGNPCATFIADDAPAATFTTGGGGAAAAATFTATQGSVPGGKGQGHGAGAGLEGTGGATGPGLKGTAGSASAPGVQAIAGGTAGSQGDGFTASCNSSTGHAVHATQVGAASAGTFENSTGGSSVGIASGDGSCLNAVSTGSATMANFDTSFGTGRALVLKGNSTLPAFRLTPQAAPGGTLANGDMWIDVSTDQLKVRINGVTKTVTLT